MASQACAYVLDMVPRAPIVDRFLIFRFMKPVDSLLLNLITASCDLDITSFQGLEAHPLRRV